MIKLTLFTLILFILFTTTTQDSSNVCLKGWSGYYQTYEDGLINNCEALPSLDNWLSYFGNVIEILNTQANYFKSSNDTYVCYSLIIFKPIGPHFPNCNYFDKLD